MARTKGDWRRVKFTFVGGCPPPANSNAMTMRWAPAGDELG